MMKIGEAGEAFFVFETSVRPAPRPESAISTAPRPPANP